MKRANVAALALVAGSLSFAAAKPATDPLNALLSAAISAPSNVSYVGVVEVVRMGSHAAEAEVYRVEHRAPNLTRRVYTAPSGLSGDSVVSKGDLAFSIDAKRHRIVETRNGALDDPLALNADYALLLENYRVSRKGSEVFDGRRAIDLVLINKFTRRITMLVRIDETSKLVLDKEEFAPDGSLVSELRFEEVRYDATIPSADFALPKGYALVRGATLTASSESPDRAVSGAGFTAREPRSLPDGFAPVEGSLVEMRGVRTVHCSTRTESARSRSSRTRRPRRWTQRVSNLNGCAWEVTVRSMPRTARARCCAWSDGTLYYTLVGELGLVDLQRIAASIAP